MKYMLSQYYETQSVNVITYTILFILMENILNRIEYAEWVLKWQVKLVYNRVVTYNVFLI